MRSVELVNWKGKFVIVVVADSHTREYVETDLEVAKARIIKLKQILNIK